MSQITTVEFETFVLPILKQKNGTNILLRDVSSLFTCTFCSTYCTELCKSYTKQVEIFGKNMFDPFNRGELQETDFVGEDTDGTIRTFKVSAAQINFFRWAIDENVFSGPNLEAIKKSRNIHRCWDTNY